MILSHMYTDERGQTRFAGEQIPTNMRIEAMRWKPVSAETKKWSKPVESPQRTSFLETSGE